MRDYKDCVPQEWKKIETNNKPEDYVAIIRLSLNEYLIQNLKQGWKPATCALLNEDGTPDVRIFAKKRIVAVRGEPKPRWSAPSTRRKS